MRFGKNEDVKTDTSFFTDEMKERLTFDWDHHLKDMTVEESIETASEERIETASKTSDVSEILSLNESTNSSSGSNLSFQETQEQMASEQVFRRVFSNLDQTTCWLNSWLQLILNGMDQSDSEMLWTSELGVELLRLQKSTGFPLN